MGSCLALDQYCFPSKYFCGSARTSYDRWYEGSKDWESSISDVRNLSRQLWVSVTVPPKIAPVKAGVTRSKASSAEPLTASSVREHKIRALHLVSAFLFAVKHHLRNEVGVHYDDMAGLLPESFSKYDIASSAASMTPEHAGGFESPLTSGHESPVVTRVTGASHHQSSSDQRTPLLAKDQHHTIHFHPYAPPSQPSLPLLIAHELTRIVHRFRAQGCLDSIGPPGANAINGLIQSMINQLAKMERVSNTPIPASYGIHLKQCVTLYLFTLPFTLVADLRWFMVPGEIMRSTVLILPYLAPYDSRYCGELHFDGYRGIADEIEMPFGTDYYDLPLDRLCVDVRAEIQYMIHNLPEGSDEWEDFQYMLGAARGLVAHRLVSVSWFSSDPCAHPQKT
ncbi:hypothetical protein BS47DRAFT_998920 [Hydnum rufescens UP504]|uniref:Uncharacterized protein n=1 Tax=Hydnum rufescens UP504 TaxID=1448309 RepID=A0A9P6BBM9_9AGAM|nr:hypothetical protein BS47DRAFT_998920 [Hydnum rufescens UP504]